MHFRNLVLRIHMRMVFNLLFVLAVLITLVAGYTFSQARARSASPGGISANQAFSQASSTYGVPAELLKAICYMEGRLSNNGGNPSDDNGFGCMHLVKNRNADTLDRAAQELGVSVDQLRQDLSANINGGAAILRDDALQTSSTHTLPGNLAGWYGAVAVYSDATLHSTALLYADNAYKILQEGFSAQTEQGETVTLSPQAVQPNTTTANSPKAMMATTTAALPAGCTNDGNVDYPGAIDCILNPQTYDCNITPTNTCNFTGSDRPNSCTINNAPQPSTVIQPCTIDQIAIHDIEGSATSALNVFQDVNSHESVHYIVDSDGTVYQVLREHDIAFHVGNFWYNEHSIGIEHAGFDATGYAWYNATEYLASAKLVAYLLKKYNLPLDRSHVVAHGTVPSPSLAASPNHVDPGPYWLWDYYFSLISQQGVALSPDTALHSIILHPRSDQAPAGPNGTETTANFNFFYLYKGPSTSSGLIPQQNTSADVTDVTNSIEPGIPYYYFAKELDAAGSGDTMYEIWYGEEDRVHTSQSSFFADAMLAWIAVPAGDGVEGVQNPKPGVFYTAPLVKVSGNDAQIYGRPTTDSQDVIGSAPVSSVFLTGYTVIEDGTGNLWYEINYNHRQAWVPASEVVRTHPAP